MPYCFIIGIKTGTRISTAGAASMNIPTKSRNIWMMNRTAILLFVMEIIRLHIFCGIWSIARTQPITPAMEAIISIAALITAERIIIGRRSLNLIFL